MLSHLTGYCTAMALGNVVYYNRPDIKLQPDSVHFSGMSEIVYCY